MPPYIILLKPYLSVARDKNGKAFLPMRWFDAGILIKATIPFEANPSKKRKDEERDLRRRALVQN
jgi:hypothetical protein